MLAHEQLNNNNTPKLTEIETIVIGIWSEVLQKKDITLEDNFFELGCPFGKPAQGKKRVKNTTSPVFFWSGHYRRAIYHPEGGWFYSTEGIASL